ncbi:NADH-quinone oxidoreductase [Fomitopsis serialis]|uniref:NADH-quinone oxidoreductase n=1 Tax=Fomitopsis serialis TaxID=139415 RepID=UPI00200776D1|nr:NADH-quinone oxidoreductase [Neoantrodia serialis]KAH9933892.1 NADH-quinone oxidoreductase [Neoantrodia serialis]
MGRVSHAQHVAAVSGQAFPSKKTKAAFDDDKPSKASPPKDINQPTSTSTTTPAPTAMSPKIAIIIYSMYGHVAKLAESVKSGVDAAGGSATIYQVAETLPEAVLEKMHAPPKGPYPVIQPADLTQFDAFIFGVPTRYGNMPAQLKAFIDGTGQLWAQGALAGKYVSVFVSTAGLGGGQETTVINLLSTFVHHGLIFVPLGYSKAFPSSPTSPRSTVHAPHTGSPWGAGAFAGTDGSRQPSALELQVAKIQGEHFYSVLSKVNF